MLRIAPFMILAGLVVDSYAADTPRFDRSPHLLHTTFEQKDFRLSFNHEVKVRSRAEQLTMVVLDDKENQKPEDAASKAGQNGLGNPAGDGAAKRSECPSAPQPLLSAKRKLHGSIDSEGGIQFGTTTIHDGNLISLHFVGRSTLGGASGKVYLLSLKGPVREGTWYLKNSFSRGGAVPGFNGTSPIGP